MMTLTDEINAAQLLPKPLGIDYLIFQHAEAEVASREIRLLECRAKLRNMIGPDKVSHENLVIDLIDSYLAAMDRLAWLILRGVAPQFDHRGLYQTSMANCENSAERRFGPDPHYKNIAALNRMFKEGR